MKAMIAAVLLLSAAGAQAQVASPAPVAIDPRFAPLAAGAWSFVAIPGGSEAAFTGPTGARQLTLRCTKATRRITVSKPVGAGTSTMTLWSTDGSRAIAGRLDPVTANLSVELAATDAILDQLAFSRGRFSVSAAGSPPLVVPAWPEAARAIEDCRI